MGYYYSWFLPSFIGIFISFFRYLPMRELQPLSLRSLVLDCLSILREDAFSAIARSADMARTAATATVDKAARRVLIFLTIVAQL